LILKKYGKLTYPGVLLASYSFNQKGSAKAKLRSWCFPKWASSHC